MHLQTFSTSTMLMLIMMVLSYPFSLCSYNNDDHDGQRLSFPLKTISDHDKMIYVTPRRQLATSSSSSKVVSVTDYGAKGDGKSDDSEAFQKAWKKACSTENGVLEVPEKTFLLGQNTFSGPCKYSLTMKVYGTILASGDRSDYKRDLRHWIIFENIKNFNVLGGGHFDGNGYIWWTNSCKFDKSKPCKKAPTAVTFHGCNNLNVENIVFQNAQQMTVSFQKCVGVSGSKLVINSPGWSPNTDGIHITSSQNVQLSECSIKTGDDCISIESGSHNIKASDIVCGPGHGISIGSLGDNGSKAKVSDVVVNRARLSGTSNGVRIKTWQGGSGYARRITFQNIQMDNVSNPIVIDQDYCDSDDPCKEQSNAVQVENVLYSNISGTSASEKAINIVCSEKHPCKGIQLQNINLTTLDEEDEAKGVCKNAQVSSIGSVSPKCANQSDDNSK